jgi:hypothetical protein
MTRWLLAVGHSLTPKHCTVHATYCVLFAGPVSLLLIQHNPNALWSSFYSTLFSGSVCVPFGHFLVPVSVLWPLCLPLGHCLAPKCHALHITLATASPQNILHFISHTIPCFQDQFDCQLATASPQNIVCFISHTLPCFQDLAGWPATALPQSVVHFISHTLLCFQDLLAGHLATALPQNLVHFHITCSTLFFDQFACQLATA